MSSSSSSSSGTFSAGDFGSEGKQEQLFIRIEFKCFIVRTLIELELQNKQKNYSKLKFSLLQTKKWESDFFFKNQSDLDHLNIKRSR